jgi:8-oxo-dGTP pyrophosphatase MutT (NUDIX family)
MDTRGGAAPDWTQRYRLVAGVYAMRDGYILMLERASGMMIGFWSVPGGHVESGETPQDAAARELFEEAGPPVSTYGSPHMMDSSCWRSR